MSGATASERLERVLHILPTAARDGGASLEELARALDVPVATIVADIEHVAAREYYHPGGSVDSFSMTLSGDRVHVRAAHEFRRPVRLNARETLALGLGLRVLASEAEPARAAALIALAQRLEEELRAPDTLTAVREEAICGDALPSASMAPAAFDDADDEDDAPPDYDADEQAGLYLDLGMDDARGALADAIETRRRCTIAYVKPGAAAPEERTIEPYTLVYGDGQWYVIAMDRARGALRVFRLDRILEARAGVERFEPVADFDAARFLAGGAAPFLAEHDVEVTVRYAPAIGRWITERTGVAPEADGGVLLRHRVADSRWLVRHVLQYGGAATIESVGDGGSPEPWRALVAEAAARVADRL